MKFPFRIKFVKAWFDLWIGFYYDRKQKVLYFMPVPMIGIAISKRKKDRPKKLFECKICNERFYTDKIIWKHIMLDHLSSERFDLCFTVDDI